MPADSFLYDTFADSGLVLLQSHTPEVGGAWAISGGAGYGTVAGGAAQGGSTIYNVRYRNDAYVPPDFYLEASFRLTTSSGTPRIIFRGVDALNFYYFFAQPTGFGISKWVAGSPTSVGGVTTTIALNTDYTVRLQVRGSEMSATVVQVARTIDVTDTTYPNAGWCGLWFPSGRETVDSLDVRQLPSRFLYDTMTEAVDTPLASHIPEFGAAWNYFSTPISTVIASEGRAAGSDAANGTVAFNYVKIADGTISATLRRTGGLNTNSMGLVGRLQTTGDSRYATIVDLSGIVSLTKRVAGTTTTITTANVGSVLSTVDYTEELRISGTTITVLWNGALVIGPTTDTSITGPGYWGYVQRQNGRVDNIEAWTTATAYAALPAISQTAMNATGAGAALATSALPPLALAPPAVVGAGAAYASASLGSISLTPIVTVGRGGAAAVAALPSVSLLPPEALAIGGTLVVPDRLKLKLSSIGGAKVPGSNFRLKLTRTGRLTIG